MATWRQALEVVMTDEEVARLSDGHCICAVLW